MSLQKPFAAVGVVAVLVVLGGAAYRVFTPIPPAIAPTGVPKTLSELPLTQHFSVVLGEVGALNGNSSNPPFIVTMPTSMGIAISQLTPKGAYAANPHIIRCDGIEVWNGRLGANSPGAIDLKPVFFSPPLIIRPGSLLEIYLEISSQTVGSHVTMGGYILTAADLGL